ncbi:MAG TPA: ABC transporter ATP-binding protein [Candidatus Binataceae bacterium]|nr:ABC transporter ATP-binding protein [Candidatus Binataceae bacterium]
MTRIDSSRSPSAAPASDGARAIIEVHGLRVERDALILDAIDWRVGAGEHWVILGANGSGKTSLLSVLTGYLGPTAGTISVLGETYGRADWRELRTRIGLVSSSIHQLMPGHETALNAVVSGRSAMIGMWGEAAGADRRRALEILREVEAEYLVDRPWRVLSQGERQRVLIGRALIAAPQLLVLDEPCAGLDPVAREHFLGFIERLLGRGGAPTLVLVTHHVEEIVAGFSHVLVLRGGRVLEAGPRSRVMTSATLARAFDAPLELASDGGRYSLKVGAEPAKVV